MTLRISLACVAVACSGLYAPALEAEPRQPIVVHDAPGLQAALKPENAGRRIHVLLGDYLVTAPLIVPDGTTVEGDGVMLGSGLPDGFEPGSETRIAPDPHTPFTGDLVTLGHGATLTNLVVEDMADRAGNVVAVHSRVPEDRVAASIIRCEIIDPKTPGAGPDGPVGRALAVLTSNRSMGNAPPPDEDAEVSLTLTHSIVRATAASSAVFAINFASRGAISISAKSNRIFGSIEITGGVSRPNEVNDASVTMVSEGNVYAPAGGTPVGWTIDGGSGAPVPKYVAPGTSGNQVRFTSFGDVIDEFPTGIVATAGKRHNDTSDPNSHNLVVLHLIGLRIRTIAGGADVVFHAAASDGVYAPGDDNVLRVLMSGVNGSGERANDYDDEVGAGLPQTLGTGNRLEMIGNAVSFRVRNPGILPPPDAEFFGGRHR